MLNKKRILAAALALAMAASMLTACGGKGKQEGAAGAAGTAVADVDPAALKFPLAEKAEISGLTS